MSEIDEVSPVQPKDYEVIKPKENFLSRIINRFKNSHDDGHDPDKELVGDASMLGRKIGR